VIIDVSPHDFWLCRKCLEAWVAEAKAIVTITGGRHAELRLGTFLRQAGLRPN